MQVIEVATIVGRTRGENDKVIVLDERTGNTFSLNNSNGLNLETGLEGTAEIDALSAQILSFEQVYEEELA